MHTLRKWLLSTAAVVLAAALVVVGVQYSGSSSEVTTSPVAEQVKPLAPAIPIDQMKKALLPPSMFPTGSTITEMSLQQLVAAGLDKTPPDMIVEPARCADGLGDGVGDASRTAGWAQFVTAPDGTLITSFVASVNSGANFNRIRETISLCQSARVTLTEFGLVGTLRLTEFAGPVLFGASSIGVETTATFPGGNRVAAAGRLIAALNTASVYVASGTLMIETCKPPQAAAMAMATQMYNQFNGGTAPALPPTDGGTTPAG